ncbi:MAG: putative toxin-antitoxin system toxin component, PIN family [Terracidiphilus sp.]|jgi:putative PIN family toxin of toxin-antitoxin system
MTQTPRVVLDTNVAVSGLLFPGSVPAQAIFKAQSGTVLASGAMRLELLEVFSRPHFDRYATREDRLQLASAFIFATVEVLVTTPIRACRDPRDDKFLEAAVHGRADAIVTGDLDLLTLDPFHGIRILTPAAFLDGQTL